MSIEQGKNRFVNVHASIKEILKFVKVDVSTEKKLLISILLILTSVALNPLFYYIPIINNDSHCLGLDSNLRIIVVVFLTCVDGVYIVLWWGQRQGLETLYGKQYQTILSRAAILVVLPLPQVVVYATSWRLITVKLLKFIVLIQLAPRIFLIAQSFIYAKKIPDRRINMWLAAAFYFSLYMLASNLLGAFWYLRVVERNMDCWKKACKFHDLCGVSSFYCDVIMSNNRYLDEFCLIPPAPNSKFFDHGIYLDAFKRDIMGVRTRFLDKFFYCFWWGLQSLSSLGQNLEPGTYIWDNFFAIFIVISGLLLLALLIGNMQVYLQKDAASDVESAKTKEAEEAKKEEERKRKREEKMKWIKKELVSWRPFDSISYDMKRKVMSCEDPRWLQIAEINLETFLNKLQPLDIRRKIRKELCENLFSKVEKFDELNPLVKTALQIRASPIIFKAGSTIHKEGYPIYKMIHIVVGKVLVFSRDNNKKEGLRRHNHRSDDSNKEGSQMHNLTSNDSIDKAFSRDTNKKEGFPMHSLKSDDSNKEGSRVHNLTRNDSIGKELLDNALESPEPILPLASETVEALTKVEAFALSFDDLVSVFTQHKYAIPSYRNIFTENESPIATKKRAAIMKKMTSSHEA